MLFLSREPHKAQLAQQIVNQELAKETLSVAGWRKVPTNPKVLGPIALDSLPDIQQVFISAPAGWRERDVERRLYIARRRIENRLRMIAISTSVRSRLKCWFTKACACQQTYHAFIST